MDDEDNCVELPTDLDGNADPDGDGFGNACDNCPDIRNDSQSDIDYILLLSDSDSYYEWLSVDDGYRDGPSIWEFQEYGTIAQKTNIRTLSPYDPEWYGTYFLTGNSMWTDYTISLRLMSFNDNDGIGIMFRVIDSDNYYRFGWWSDWRLGRYLEKVVDGDWTVLYSDDVIYNPNQWYRIKIEVNGTNIKIYQDGEQICSITDSSFPHGKIALYSWNNRGSYFDDVLFIPNSTSTEEIYNTYYPDGRGDVCDNCYQLYNPSQINHDGDDRGNTCDNCPKETNPEQSDMNMDGVGDVCDCTDGIRAGAEIGIDCGGDCPIWDCRSNLYQDVDLGETGVDCGGIGRRDCIECTWCNENTTPVWLTGDEHDKIDIVFVADQYYLNHWSQFEWLVRRYIIDGYLKLDDYTNTNYPLPDYLKEMYNFYTWDGDYYDGRVGRRFTAIGFVEEVPFADAGIVLVSYKSGGASGMGPGPARGATVGTGGLNVLLHESGHKLFALTDEYCGNTGYPEDSHMLTNKGNVWFMESDCNYVENNEGWTTGSCRIIGDPFTCSWLPRDIWRYDTDECMMASARDDFGEACSRRIQYVLENWPKSGSRGVLVYLNINDGLITELNSSVASGHPNIGLQPEYFSIEAFSSTGELLNRWGIWDPRIILTDTESDMGLIPGMIYTDNVDFPLIFPFYENLRRIDISDSSSGDVIISVDLADTLYDFCSQNNYDGADCQSLDLDNDGIKDVEDACPTIGAIIAPLDPIQVNTSIDVAATLVALNGLDTYTAVWDWGDSTTPSDGTISETDGQASITGSHSYSESGVYTVKLTVKENGVEMCQSVFQYVVVYDPTAGFVTGGGWINSSVGAYVPDPSLTGKANFGFVSKYKKGANAPTGETEFQFKVADLNFHSDSYDWLVIAGHQAKYKGTGTINGDGEYGFMLTAIDEKLTPSKDVDLFRIKIWDKDDNDTIVYDNQMGDADDKDPTTEIGGGSIVIHKQK
jgi:hypothetical protein